MHRVLRSTGHDGVRDPIELNKFLELEAAALPCRPYASFDAPGYPGYRVPQEVGPWVFGFDVEGFHG